MNTFLLIGIALIAASPSAASPSAASPTPVSAPLPVPTAAPVPSTPAPRKETLRLKFPVGQTLGYTLMEDTAGSYLEPHHRIAPIKSHLEMQEHQTVAD